MQPLVSWRCYSRRPHIQGCVECTNCAWWIKTPKPKHRTLNWMNEAWWVDLEGGGGEYKENTSCGILQEPTGMLKLWSIKRIVLGVRAVAQLAECLLTIQETWVWSHALYKHYAYRSLLVILALWRWRQGIKIQGHSQLHSEVEVSLGYMRPWQRTKHIELSKDHRALEYDFWASKSGSHLYVGFGQLLSSLGVTVLFIVFHIFFSMGRSSPKYVANSHEDI